MWHFLWSVTAVLHSPREPQELNIKGIAWPSRVIHSQKGTLVNSLKSECPHASDKVGSQHHPSSFLTSPSYRAPSYLAPIYYPSFALMENRGATTAQRQ